MVALKMLQTKCSASLSRIAIAVVCALALLHPCSAAAQEEDSYKFDIGIGAGMSGYLGDVNSANMFRRPGIAANVSFRYLASARFAVRGLFTFATLSGNTADWDNVFPGIEAYSFHSKIFELAGRAEFNFLPYGMGETYKRLSRWTPYLSLGLGCLVSTCSGTTAVAPTIPMGFGFKFKPSKRTNIALEFSMVKIFGNKVDGLVDPYTIKSAFAKNTDWYSSLIFSFSYEFGPRCVVCHRQE
ncbi:MAG: outer membrane beta-barrel protein [Muribaculaceae bacterium]|nr:outer membrane beta-barrel protein [Muribaculaceae bacterium]